MKKIISMWVVFVFLLVPMHGMALDESFKVIKNKTYEVSGTKVPAALYQQVRKTNKLVIYLHGFSSNKESGAIDQIKLAQAGFDVLAIDAPHHGARRTPKLDSVLQGTDAERFSFILRVIESQVLEISALLTILEGEGYTDFTVVGVSMGGLAAYGVPVNDKRISKVVSILGNPYWELYYPSKLDAKVDYSPWQNLNRYENTRVLSINAEKDTLIPPRYAKEFTQKLLKKYPMKTDNYQYHEVPNGTHFLDENDWNDVWKIVLDWLNT